MDYMEYSSYPVLASTDYSPTSEAFPYPTSFLADPFAGLNASLGNFDDYYGHPTSSCEAKPLDCTSAAAASTHLKSTPNSTFVQHGFIPPPVDQLNLFSPGFRLDTGSHPPNASFDLNFSPLSDSSKTPSLCGDAPSHPLPSPPLSPSVQDRRCSSTGNMVKFEDPANPSPPRRKRGRPRLDRNLSSSSASAKMGKGSQRLPHNQVERKYREGLNASLERLRKTVPTLCDEKLDGILGHPKPSKAMILEGAIDYIKDIERERDAYRSELERLRRDAGWESDTANNNAAYLPTDCA